MSCDDGDDDSGHWLWLSGTSGLQACEHSHTVETLQQCYLKSGHISFVSPCVVAQRGGCTAEIITHASSNRQNTLKHPKAFGEAQHWTSHLPSPLLLEVRGVVLVDEVVCMIELMLSMAVSASVLALEPCSGCEGVVAAVLNGDKSANGSFLPPAMYGDSPGDVFDAGVDEAGDVALANGELAAVGVRMGLLPCAPPILPAPPLPLAPAACPAHVGVAGALAPGGAREPSCTGGGGGGSWVAAVIQLP